MSDTTFRTDYDKFELAVSYVLEKNEALYVKLARNQVSDFSGGIRDLSEGDEPAGSESDGKGSESS